MGDGSNVPEQFKHLKKKLIQKTMIKLTSKTGTTSVWEFSNIAGSSGWVPSNVITRIGFLGDTGQNICVFKSNSLAIRFKNSMQGSERF